MKNVDQMKEDFSKGFNEFLSRKGMKGVDIANEFSINPASVSCWKIKKALPNFDKAVSLLEMGMTVQEMFGENLGKEILRNSLEAMGLNLDTTDSSKKYIEELNKDREDLKRSFEEIEDLKRSFEEIKKSRVYSLEVMKQIIELDSERMELTQEQKKELLEGIDKQIKIVAK